MTAYDNLSCTDVDCAWIRSKPTNTADTETQDELYQKPLRPAVLRQATKEEVTMFTNALKPETVGFTWLFKSDPGPRTYQSRCSEILVKIDVVLNSQEFKTKTIVERQNFLATNLKLDWNDIKIIAEDTIGQTKSANWHIARTHRLTASNFGLILSAIKRKSFPKSFWERLTGKFKSKYIFLTLTYILTLTIYFIYRQARFVAYSSNTVRPGQRMQCNQSIGKLYLKKIGPFGYMASSLKGFGS